MQVQRKNKKELTRQKILDASSELFFQSGYDDTSYADIAKRAGVGYGTVYSHYPNKESLLIDQAHDLMTQQIEALRHEKRGERTHLEQARHLINLSWTMSMMLPARMRSIYMSHRWTGSKTAYTRGNRMRDELLSFIVVQLEKAQKAGEIDPNIDVPTHMIIMDGAYIKAMQAARFGGADQAEAKQAFDKQLEYLLRL